MRRAIRITPQLSGASSTLLELAIDLEPLVDQIVARLRPLIADDLEKVHVVDRLG